jgi:hypothetical protein
MPGGVAGSRLTSRISSQFVGVVVIADKAEVGGLEIGAVADYVAALALAEAGTSLTCQPLATIMNLFASGCAAGDRADRATAADLAYLRALYTTDPTLYLEIQQGELAGKMERSLGR